MITENLITTNLSEAISTRRLSGVTIWNRLEGRPRAEKFDRALRAEVHDALWMLTRQWQMGEFRGDDAGSPILTKVKLETTRLRKYQPDDGPVEEFNDAIPLESQVEQMPLPLLLAKQEMSRRLRCLITLRITRSMVPILRNRLMLRSARIRKHGATLRLQQVAWMESNCIFI